MPSNKQPLKMDDAGLDLLSEREGGFVLVPYRDTEGVWTDGLGNTHGVVPFGPAITLEKAKEDFARNLAWVEDALSLVRVPIEQHQHNALGSFIFNVGAPNFETSKLLRILNEGAPTDTVAAQFDRWHIPASIISRRNGEREQFRGVHFQARIQNVPVLPV